MARYRNVCWTLNNPEEMTEFDEVKMNYLVYQEEIGEEGTYHLQGYAEFTSALVLSTVKRLLGGAGVHVEKRMGTQKQAIAYCKEEEKRLAHTEPYEWGTPNEQGKRVDLIAFKEQIQEGARMRDLIDDHLMVVARYPKFYHTLTALYRPKRTEELHVTLLIGDTGLGKTRYVYDKHGEDPDFYVAPLNNGTIWFDGYDGQSKVLLDDFTGKSSHFSLCSLLRVLDRYPFAVPTKGGHTWWMPNEVFITTNIYPKDWYSWENRGEQYKALARRFTEVLLYYLPMSATDCGYISQDLDTWWRENKPNDVYY